MNITPLSQRDSRWASVKLGNGTGTIGNFGCLLVIVTVAVNSRGANITPLEANEKLKAVGGFAGDTKNLLVWSALSKAFPQVKSNGIPETYNNDVAKEMLAKGFPVIVEVDGAPIGAPSHWILLIGNSQMVDPWTGKIEATSKYAIRKMVRWELQGSQSTTDLEACLTAHKKAVDDYNALDKEYTQKKLDWIETEKRLISEKDQAIKDKEVIIKNLNSELDAKQALLKSAQDQVTAKNKTIQGLEHEVERLEKKVEMCGNALDEANVQLEKTLAEYNIATGELTLVTQEKHYLVAEVDELRQKVKELTEAQDSKPIPYKKLYEESLDELKILHEKFDKDMVIGAKHSLLRGLQRAIYDIESYLKK
jgi:hypothetical protein